MTLTVLIDATAVPENRGGVGRYVDGLVPALTGTGVAVVVVAQRRDVERFATSAPLARVVAAPAWVGRRPARLLWEQAFLAGLASSVGADVLHSPHYTRPVLSRVPSVVTVHDATFFSHPEVHGKIKGRFFRAATRRAVRSADAIVVPSRATREEVIRFVAADPGLFHVAYHGVDHRTFRPPTPSAVAEMRELVGLGDQRYIAFLGTIEPRKNVPALVRAWVDACSEDPDPPALVLAGARGWDTEIDGLRAEVPERLCLLVPGYVPFDSLGAFLGGATIVAYPSLGEGFGLPVLEAMACGACVLTTRELSLPEVGGEAVAYCGTASEDIAAELAALLVDDDRRRQLSQAARRRSESFTWEASAKSHVEAYEAARSRPRS